MDSGYLMLGLSALLPAVATAIIYAINGRYGKKANYMLRQVIIGIIFGLLAIFSTEFGIPIDGATMNCRDASVLCAGLFFGGPAGIIAGTIGGVERYLAVAWGAGAFTAVACSVSTFVAGIFAAIMRNTMLEGHSPNCAFAFMSGLVVEAFHMSMCFFTNMGATERALEVVKACTGPMTLFNSLAVMVAALLVAFIKWRRYGYIEKERKSVLVTLQNRLLLFVVITFALTSVFNFAVQTRLAQDHLESTMAVAATDAANDIEVLQMLGQESNGSYHHVGRTGYVMIVNPAGTIVSGPGETLGLTPESIGLPADWPSIAAQNDAGLSSCTSLPANSATILGTASEWSAASAESYSVITVSPDAEAYESRDNDVTITTLVQILMFAVIFGLVHYLMRRRVVEPVRTVNKELDDIAHDKLDTEIDVRSNLEFVQLSDGINATVDSLKQHISAEAARIDEDLAFARSIQSSSLPSIFPDRPEIDLYARMDTAKEVGGDFYDFYFTRNDTIALTIADVSGKGIPAAMFMMRAKTVIKSILESQASMRVLFSKANDHLCENNDAMMFVTAWTCVVNVDRGDIVYTNAGHNPPAIRMPGGKFELMKIRPGMVLGGMEGINFPASMFHIDPGTELYLYTDGITEATNANDELFGEKRLLEVLNSPEYDAADMEGKCALVKARIDEFVGDAPQFDDMTMLAFRYNGRDMSNVKELRLLASIDNIAKVTAFVNEQLEENGIDRKIQGQMDIAIDELFGNIAKYAYGSEIGPVTIRLEVCKDPQEIRLTFVDFGRPYNPLEKADPDVTLSAEDREIGGLGIYMVKQSMDEVFYKFQNEQNFMCVVKRY